MGEQFGRYRLDGLVGSGGMGEVFRAFDTVKKRTVALKRLPAHLAADRDFQARFRREAELAARLTEPHIIPIHDYGEIDGLLYIDMRLISGIDLADLIDEVGPLPPARAVSIIAQVASALAAAHAEHLIHRDVKPSNVLISRSDRGEDFVHLLDFGVARTATGTALTATGSAIGTVDYMAPEQFDGGGIDHRVDVYALGCLLYECLTAEKPFPTGGLPAVMKAHLNAPPPRPSQRRSDVPSGLDRVVARAMAKQPDERFASTTELAIAAEQSLRERPGAEQHGAAATRAVTTNVYPPSSPGLRPTGPLPVRSDHPAPGSYPPPSYQQGSHQQGSYPPPSWRPDPPAQAGASYPPPSPPDRTRVETSYRGGGAPRSRRRGRPVVLAAAAVAVLVAVAAVVYLLPRSTAQRSATTPTPAAAGVAPTGAAQESPAESAAESAAPDAAAGGVPAEGAAVEVSGPVNGPLAAAGAVCSRQDAGWSWLLEGTVEGKPVQISYITNAYRGSADYRTTTITDDQGGQLTVYIDNDSFVSNGASTGTLTVTEDEKSGNLSADLDSSAGSGQRISLAGSWRCA